MTVAVLCQHPVRGLQGQNQAQIVEREQQTMGKHLPKKCEVKF